MATQTATLKVFVPKQMVPALEICLAPESWNVLVLDHEASVLALMASVFSGNGIRPLLARDAAEAMEIARRTFVPIDLLLLRNQGMEPQTRDAVAEICRIRPQLHVVGMSACIEDGVIRISLPGNVPGTSLLEEVRAVCAGSADFGIRRDQLF